MSISPTRSSATDRAISFCRSNWASHLEVLWEQLFVQVLSALARFARVLWFDMRGVGLSDRVLDAPAAAEDRVNDVASSS